MFSILLHLKYLFFLINMTLALLYIIMYSASKHLILLPKVAFNYLFLLNSKIFCQKVCSLIEKVYFCN